MTDQNVTEFPDFETMTPAEFERCLPDIFAASSNGKVSNDPKLQKFLSQNPDCAALVSDFETIFETVAAMFKADSAEPSDLVWDELQVKLKAEAALNPPQTGNED
jgi:hypothetical protein